jgi:hypothetical protein
MRLTPDKVKMIFQGGSVEGAAARRNDRFCEEGLGFVRASRRRSGKNRRKAAAFLLNA